MPSHVYHAKQVQVALGTSLFSGEGNGWFIWKRLSTSGQAGLATFCPSDYGDYLNIQESTHPFPCALLLPAFLDLGAVFIRRGSFFAIPMSSNEVLDALRRFFDCFGASLI
mmetsp:Transcript_24431/g.37357  ORF Transcript_24431/g.37357 Transcript_24431/m.37357 type:complete len:111 (-) Transcript_24431:629-961(-)